MAKWTTITLKDAIENISKGRIVLLSSSWGEVQFLNILAKVILFTLF
jgi:hypothetical protein